MRQVAQYYMKNTHGFESYARYEVISVFLCV